MGTEVLLARDYLAHYRGHQNDHFMGMIYPHEKVHHYGKKSPQHPQSKKKSGHGHGSSPKIKVKGENTEKKRSSKPKPQEESQLEVLKQGAVNRTLEGCNCKFGHRNEYASKKEPLVDKGKETAKNLVLTGQVTILKRGQALKPNNNGSSQLEIAKEKTACFVVTPKEIPGPDPTHVTKNRTLTSRSVSSKGSKAAALPSVPKLSGFEPETTERGNGIKTLNFPLLISEKWAGPAYTNSPPPSCLPLPTFSPKKFGKGSAEIDRFATRDLRRLLGLD